MRKHIDRKKYIEGEHPQGKQVEVTFADGEIMVGSTLGYDPNRPGFFVFPADPNCNNLSSVCGYLLGEKGSSALGC